MSESASVRAMPTSLNAFLGGVTCLGAAVVAYSLYALPAAPNPAGWALLGILGIIAASFPVKVPGVPVYLSISDTFFITSALMFGPAPATLTIALDSLIISLRRRNHWRQLLFNTTSSALALWCGVQVYYGLVAAPPLSAGGTIHTWMIAPVMTLAAVYFGLNSGLTATAVALSRRVRALEIWRQHFAIIGLNFFAAASASFLLIILMDTVGLSAVMAVTPLICICYLAMRSWLGRVEDAQRHLDKVNKMYLSTIGAFSTAIEAKDGVTSDHVHRVQAYALGLARALGIADARTLQALEAAALLHDTGKLAVPEHILNKPGRLTASEFAIMQSHVDVGADILSSIDFPYPVVPIVRAHHENWDGTGYPRGLRGEDIPIGARILSVVDCFDALTSDRPYRRAMSEQQAMDIILERRGTMYDPRVVDMFVRVCRDIAPQLAAQPTLQSAVRHIRQVHQPQPPVASGNRATADVPASDCSDELLAFVSLERLTARTAAPRDVGILAWGYLRHLAPRSTFLLLTVDPVRSVLTTQYAAGASAARLQAMTIEIGQRVSGWVAANWQPMFNAQAMLDLSDRADDLQYTAAMPLINDGRLLGVLTLYAAEPFGDSQARRLEMITPHVAAALAAVDSASSRIPSRDLRIISRR